MKTWRVWAAGAAVTALTLAACGGGEGAGEGAAAAEEDPIKIGLSVSESGINASVSRDYLAGLEIWADMINNQEGVYADRESPGLLGRPVELVYFDDESNPETSLRIYERLINREDVDFVMGPYGSGNTGVVAPRLEAQGYAIIAAAASGEHLYHQGLDMMVMVPAPTSRYAAGLPAIVESQGYKSVSMITVDNPFAASSADWLREQWREMGVEVVTDEIFTIGQRDFTAIWTQVAAQNPDFIVLNMFGDDAVRAMRQASQLRLAPQMWAVITGAWRNDVFTEGVGEQTAECVISDHHWLPGSGFEGSEAFAEAWLEEFGDPRESAAGSDPAGAWGFAGGQVLTEAVDAVGPEAVEDQRLIVDYLKSNEFETVLGDFKIDPETGINIGTEAMLVQFQDGKRVVIAPEELAEAEPKLPCAPR